MRWLIKVLILMIHASRCTVSDKYRPSNLRGIEVEKRVLIRNERRPAPTKEATKGSEEAGIKTLIMNTMKTPSI